MNTIKLSLYQIIFCATLWHTTPAQAMVRRRSSNESDANLQRIIKQFNDKALNEIRLRTCARDNKQEELKKVLGEPDVDVNAKDPFTFNAALHLAVANGHLEIGKILLQQKNIDVNSQGNNGRTPLHIATYRKNPEYTWLLLEHKAKTDIANIHGKFPDYYTYPAETGGTPPKTPSKEELSLDTKTHSCLLYDKLIKLT